MSYADVKGMLKAQPFQPFRIKMNNGDRFDVMHPELAKNSLTAVTIYSPSGEDVTIPESMLMICSMQNIATIELIPGENAVRVA